MTEIYYVEDDEAIAAAVAEYLERRGCRVTVFREIAAAKRALLGSLPDVAFLDWNMPDGQGDALCRWIRGRWQKLPVIFLTVKSAPADIVSGFENGADDYVEKPFDLAVLYSRIQAVLRRSGQNKESRLYCDQICLDRERLSVFLEQEEVALSQPEYQLLLTLMEQKGKTVTRTQLLERVWDQNGNFVNDNTLTVTMKRLREKLHNPACIKTVRSFGYRMEDTI